MTTATVDDLLALARAASEASLFPTSEFHGLGHWQGVADQAMWLCEREQAYPTTRVFAFVFGAVHDCRRLNDDWDPEHGARAAQWLVEHGWMARLGISHLEQTMVDSLVAHDKGMTAPDQPLLALGWDADRSLLGRVGIDPHPRFFSVATEPALFQTFVQRGERVARKPDCWTALARRALA